MLMELWLYPTVGNFAQQSNLAQRTIKQERRKILFKVVWRKARRIKHDWRYGFAARRCREQAIMVIACVTWRLRRLQTLEGIKRARSSGGNAKVNFSPWVTAREMPATHTRLWGTPRQTPSHANVQECETHQTSM
jgi:hypothetical protein